MVSGVSGNLNNLDVLRKETRIELQKGILMEADKALKQQMRSFKTYTIFNEFLAQFDEHRGRYKFMVIEGESCTGKSYFVRWMMGDPNLVLETNCASTPEPDLREYCPLRHKAVLFDEASPDMVLRQKKLFQAPPCMVELGSSTTNCHCYKVLVYRQRLVICSNKWTQTIEGMTDEADRSWLRLNSFVLNVGSEPMFLPS